MSFPFWPHRLFSDSLARSYVSPPGGSCCVRFAARLKTFSDTAAHGKCRRLLCLKGLSKWFRTDRGRMNPQLARWMLKCTPEKIKNPGAMTADQTFTLNTGAKIPALGLGTWQSDPGQVKDAVAHALDVGYKHIDCAFVYGNENEVGEGLREAFQNGVKREDIFVTSKVWNTYHREPEECLEEGLSKLGLEYVDLYLVHWPVPMNPNGNHPLFPKHPDGSRDLDTDWPHWKTWEKMEKLLETGKTKAIGVSNYSKPFLEELLSRSSIVPAVNQIENHPYLPQEEIAEFCKSKGILIEAYSPLGSTGSPLFGEKAVQDIAEKHHVGPGTILLSYQVSKGHVVLAKSVTLARIEENMKLLKLDASEVETLDKIHKIKGTTRYVYPPFGVQLGFPDKQ